ncbi:AI-2E family transporter [Chitinophaga japonensis]|uniref:Putative PurR-regulated permease PerM n=1 Tax=Chitinophaga japonensis TaxID=104662 RepID=A0A562SSM5_CHIJA|nr:AI-2E family transporter [Chitinophaga japonensis]TWI84024.1 putative PurR-regulated permease PerM [Chitinophaga japonensis]
MNTSLNGNAGPGFRKKIWITVGITALVVIVIWIIKVTFNVFLLILAGALIALYFRGLGRLLNRKLHVPEKLSLPASIISSLLLLGLFCWFTGSQVQQQVAQLADMLPSAVENFRERLEADPIGQKVLKRLGSSEQTGKAAGILQSFFTGTFGVLGDIYVVLFLGVFFTAAPAIYVKGFLRLIPPNARPRAQEVVNRVGADLTQWLKGKLLAMLVVAVLTAIGLLILGVPMVLALSLMAGALNFIPNFGPLIAMIPAVLVGLMEDPVTAALIVGLYALIQMVESNFITPQIQKRLIRIPPALIIIAQLFMGVLTGGWGLLLATPVTVILIILLHELYIKRMEPA